MEISSLASGSSGNCTYAAVPGCRILIDAGISMRRINCELKSFGTDLGHIDAVFITHEHTDHVRALTMIEKYYRIPIFATEGTAERLLYSNPRLKGTIFTFSPGTEIDVGGRLKVEAFPTPHDAAQSVGYKIISGGATAVVATDMGYISKNMYRTLSGADFLLIESNHDVERLMSGIYPYHLKQRILSNRGHLSNDDCARLVAALAQNGTRRFLLCHLSRENNTPQAAFDACRNSLSQAGYIVGKDVFLEVAPPDRATGRYII